MVFDTCNYWGNGTDGADCRVIGGGPFVGCAPCFEKAEADRKAIEARQRADVVAEARTWINSPYHHCADVKGAGVDCALLLVRVFADTGMIEPFDPRPYPPDWHLHRDAERYLEGLLAHAREIEEPGLGDVVVFKYGRTFSHGAIVIGLDPIWIVHAFQPYGRVCEEPMSQNIQLIEPKRPRRYFSVWAR